MNDNNVLGMRKYRGSIDLGLADRINKEVADEQRRKAKLPKDAPTDAIANDRVIRYKADLHPSFAQLNAKDWIEHWASMKDKRVMMSSGDFYTILKQLRNDIENGSEAQSRKAEGRAYKLASGISDGLIFSTQLCYDSEPKAKSCDMECKIIHHFDRKDPSLYKEIPAIAPTKVGGCDLIEVLNDKIGLAFAHAFFDTSDCADDIMCNLRILDMSTISSDAYFFSTADRSFLKDYPGVKVASMGYYSDAYFIFGTSSLESTLGNSHGVRILREGEKR